MHGSCQKLNAGGELYHRTYIEELAPPKEMSLEVYKARLAESRHAQKGHPFGETAPLSVKLTTIRATSNGDCFFDAICKAFAGVHVQRNADMFKAAFEEAPTPSRPVTILELRRVVAAHYTLEMWNIGRTSGGDHFAFIDADSLETTQANIAALGEDRGDRAYWADESAIAIVQRYTRAPRHAYICVYVHQTSACMPMHVHAPAACRYLHTQLLIFKPTADQANQCIVVENVHRRPAAPHSPSSSALHSSSFHQGHASHL